MSSAADAGSWLGRWRAACGDQDASGLLDLLHDGYEEAKRSMGALEASDIVPAATVAAEGGHEELMMALLVASAGKGVDMRGVFDQAFVEACAGGHVGILRELLRVGDDRAVDVH
ncbi:unnamed protein product, partial [Symbiodinium sp. KB8]